MLEVLLEIGKIPLSVLQEHRKKINHKNDIILWLILIEDFKLVIVYLVLGWQLNRVQ